MDRTQKRSSSIAGRLGAANAIVRTDETSAIQFWKVVHPVKLQVGLFVFSYFSFCHRHSTLHAAVETLSLNNLGRSPFASFTPKPGFMQQH
jgi:hypothetical protein